MQIVGIGGLPRSGKDTLAELFMANGYYGVSFGDITRSYARERHKDKPDPISVANMTETSNWLRETQGPDVILNMALDEFKQASKKKKYTGVVLFSVRAPVEVDFILNHSGELIWMETSDKVRYERAMQNMRKGEQPITFEEFQRQEALQWKPQPGIPKESQMDISYVKQKATDVLDNNTNDKEAFVAQIKQLISTM